MVRQSRSGSSPPVAAPGSSRPSPMLSSQPILGLTERGTQGMVAPMAWAGEGVGLCVCVCGGGGVT